MLLNFDKTKYDQVINNHYNGDHLSFAQDDRNIDSFAFIREYANAHPGSLETSSLLMIGYVKSPLSAPAWWSDFIAQLKKSCASQTQMKNYF